MEKKTMVKKTLLNQTHSRPICYAYSQTLISAMPSKWKVARDVEIEEFKSIIPKIKEFVKNKVESLYPPKDMELLSKYNTTQNESCFWFTDRDEKDENGYIQSNSSKDIYANFDCDGYGRSYRYNSSGKEIGNLSIKDTIAIYFEEMVADGIDVMKYLFLSDWNKVNGVSKDYNGKRINSWTGEYRDLENSIEQYGKKFFTDNDVSLSVITPRSNHSCYERAVLVTPEEFELLSTWKNSLERIQLKWYKQAEEMKSLFKAYAEFIRTSKTLEQLVEKDPAFEHCRSKIVGTGTAVALSSVNSSLIDQCIAERQLQTGVSIAA